MPDAGNEAQVTAQRRPRRRIATRAFAALRQPGNEARFFADDAHVVDGDTDILGRDVAAAQRLDRLAEGPEQGFGFRRLVVCEDNRLAAAEGQAGHGILVGHAAR